LLEAKIISVADVVEAMTSRRPYRAALGIKEALKEIKDNAGTKFDIKVVKACVELFENNEYSIKKLN
ncbi:MAG: HD-GYP domain-containing protein, partial [Halanaerobiales bacterium]|nr:HD-GYP domain-containing protein [Halanaerobiales bacterium]